MNKIEKLTPEQEAKMLEVKNFWLDYIFSCKNNRINEQELKPKIDWLYKFCSLNEPILITVSSPLGCQYAVQILKEVFKEHKVRGKVGDEVRGKVWDEVGDEVWDEVGGKVWDEVRGKVGSEVWGKVWDEVRDEVRGKVGDEVRGKVWDEVRDEVRDEVWGKVWDEVGGKVRDEVRGKVWDEVRGKVGSEYYPFSYIGNIYNYGFLSFYDFFTQIGVINNKDFNAFKSILTSGVYDMIQLSGFCIVSELPNKILRNPNGNLHSETESAISFNDGYEQYYWNGVSVPKEWIMNKDSITKKTIVQEKNAERRRCIREIIGTKKYAILLDIKEIDKDHVNGQDVILYRTKEKDDIIDKYVYYVNVTCHSTKREYFLCIPEEAAKNAWGAVAWTFKMNAKEYQPLIET